MDDQELRSIAKSTEEDFKEIVLKNYSHLINRARTRAIDLMESNNIGELELSVRHMKVVFREDGNFYNRENEKIIEHSDLPLIYKQEANHEAVRLRKRNYHPPSYHEAMITALRDFKETITKSFLESLTF